MAQSRGHCASAGRTQRGDNVGGHTAHAHCGASRGVLKGTTATHSRYRSTPVAAAVAKSQHSAINLLGKQPWRATRSKIKHVFDKASLGAHARTRTRARTHARTHARAHARTHARTHTHTRAHTHHATAGIGYNHWQPDLSCGAGCCRPWLLSSTAASNNTQRHTPTVPKKALCLRHQQQSSLGAEPHRQHTSTCCASAGRMPRRTVGTGRGNTHWQHLSPHS
jgi:hypothetical protein